MPGSPGEKFEVNNYEDSYSGVSSLSSATATSDNSVYAELGLKVGTKKIADLAQRMGVRTKVSDNPAMTLGGLKEGVTPLELAYAYTTIANHGVRVSGSLASSPMGPVAIDSVTSDGRDDRNERKTERVFPAKVGQVAEGMLAGVVQGGTGKAAQIGEFAAGKTGTTENYGDAWFVGYNRQMTVAVWVGYPDGLKQMKTEYRGGPVAGGTYPTEIWHDFMTSFITVRDRRDAERGKERETEEAPAAPATAGPGAPAGAVRRAGADTAAGPAPEARDARPGAPAHARAAPALHPGPAPAAGAPGARPDAHPGPRGRRRRRAYAVASRSRGDDTQSLSASQKRQGSSTALVMPMRSPTARRGGGPSPGRISTGPSSALPFRPRPMPSAWVSLPGPVAQLAARARGRGGPPSARARPAARARGSAPRRRCRRPRTPRSGASGCRRRGRRRPGPAGRAAPAVRGVSPAWAWQAGSVKW